MKVCNTPQLIKLCVDAEELDYNQRIDPVHLAEMADPNGLHVLRPVTVHEHAQRVRVDAHLRCMVLVKIRDTAIPSQHLLDVQFDAYDALPGTKEAAALQTDFVQNWNATL